MDRNLFPGNPKDNTTIVALHRSAWIEILRRISEKHGFKGRTPQECVDRNRFNAFMSVTLVGRTPQECVDRNDKLHAASNNLRQSHSTGVRG